MKKKLQSDDEAVKKHNRGAEDKKRLQDIWGGIVKIWNHLGDVNLTIDNVDFLMKGTDEDLLWENVATLEEALLMLHDMAAESAVAIHHILEP